MSTVEFENRIDIYKIGSGMTIDFSGEELMKYLKAMTEGKTLINLIHSEKYDSSKKSALWLGIWSDFVPACKELENELPKIHNTDFDDAIYMDVKSGQGVIAGVNTRSILLGVYAFLTKIGCRWVRPGKNGEFIPQKDIFDISVSATEKAAYRHRGICIEGSVSYENVAEIIDWAPKVGFNGYYIQLREAYQFFARWYMHTNNPNKIPEEFTVERAKEYVKKAAMEIGKRGLLYHAVGHGWTCEPLGIRCLDWDTHEYIVTPDIAPFLAEVNGKRDICFGNIVNTNLCYSNPEVTKLIVNNIVDYICEHREIDILHFWLADGWNNSCECENCRDTRPSDYYVRMLNKLDELLAEKGLNTKVVFLIYFDLMWPPVIERLKNPERFILMFAPITRTYSKAFLAEYIVTGLPDYERNKLIFPKSVEENVAFLKAWQLIFKGDSFDFDYHFMWDHYNDPGYFRIAELLNQDIKNLKEIGLNGFVSCQTQRAFFPTGLCMYVMGRTLWDDKLDFDEMAREYFDSAFGTEGALCMEYLSMLSELFDPMYLRGEKQQVDHETAVSFSKIKEVVNNFKPAIERNLNNKDGCLSASWTYLKYHADICIVLSSALEAKAKGDKDTSLELWGKVENMVQQNEDLFQPVFDICIFIDTMRKKFDQ